MESFETRGFSEQLNIATPEQVELSFPIAGVGSRFVAILLDHLIQFVSFWILVIILVLISKASPAVDHTMDTATSTSHKWAMAILFLFFFVLFAGYFVLFEALWHGQTPGKRVMKLRVIKDSGRQMTFFESLARNTIRLIDYLPSFYLVGVIAMVCNQTHKRLGDLAAGTIVVHERSADQPLLHVSRTTLLAPQSLDLNPWAATPASSTLPDDALRHLHTQDLVIIEAFFSRALDLDIATRSAMADRVARQMAAKMAMPLPEGNPERFLEAIAFAMRGAARF